MSASRHYGILVKTAKIPRSVWLSPRGTTRLKMHASFWDSESEAQRALNALMADERNGHLIARVAAF